MHLLDQGKSTFNFIIVQVIKIGGVLNKVIIQLRADILVIGQIKPIFTELDCGDTVIELSSLAMAIIMRIKEVLRKRLEKCCLGAFGPRRMPSSFRQASPLQSSHDEIREV